jgi:aminoglycoside phosphotransferase (APT) family kinase protein
VAAIDDELGPRMAQALGAWLGRDEVEVTQISGGASNLTFRIRSSLGDWVLRRPPMGPLLPTANDMRREYAVQGALASTDVPVASMLRFCDDLSVLGAPFYLMEWLDGIVFATAGDVGHLTEDESLDCSYELMDVLACLHAVDPAAVGLSDFGRPAGFLERQVKRWVKQWESAKQRDLPEIDEVARRLTAALPPETSSAGSIVHGDYSFNNTMFFRRPPTKMRAVLDWELSTLGDPLTDVGMVAVYWAEVGAFLWRNRQDPQPHLANQGFPSVDRLLERYAVVSGRDLSRIDFYRALATFKLAVIVEGSHARTVRTDPARSPEVDATVRTLAQMALEAAS